VEKKNEDEGDKKTKTKKWKDKERKTFVFVVPKKERTDEVTTQTEANSLVTFLGGPKAVRLPFFNFRPHPPPPFYHPYLEPIQAGTSDKKKREVSSHESHQEARVGREGEKKKMESHSVPPIHSTFVCPVASNGGVICADKLSFFLSFLFFLLPNLSYLLNSPQLILTVCTS